MATHSSTLAWKIPWMEKHGRLQSMGLLRDMTERLPFHFSLSCIGEGNDNPLQCSCLENPRDGRAWWSAISGVAQSRTRLKRLSSSSSIVDLPCHVNFCCTAKWISYTCTFIPSFLDSFSIQVITFFRSFLCLVYFTWYHDLLSQTMWVFLTSFPLCYETCTVPGSRCSIKGS